MAFLIRVAHLSGDADGLARVYVSSAEHHAMLDAARYRVPDLRAVADRYRGTREQDERIMVADDPAHGIVGRRTSARAGCSSTRTTRTTAPCGSTATSATSRWASCSAANCDPDE